MTVLFCYIINNPPAHTIYSDSSFMVLLDKESLGFGHCIIIPKTHASKIYELDDKIYNELFMLAKKLSGILQSFPQNRNYQSFANTGVLRPIENAVAYASFGGGIQHAHLHLVPHNNPDVLLNPSKYIKKPDAVELEKNATQVRDFIKNKL